MLALCHMSIVLQIIGHNINYKKFHVKSKDFFEVFNVINETWSVSFRNVLKLVLVAVRNTSPHECFRSSLFLDCCFRSMVESQSTHPHIFCIVTDVWCFFLVTRTPVRQPRPSRACTSARPTSTWGTSSSSTSVSHSVATMVVLEGVLRWALTF